MCVLKSKLKIFSRLFSIVLLFASSNVSAFEVQDIRLDGLQRIAPGTVFTYLPLHVGEELDSDRATDIIQTLYATGFFLDVKLGRMADVVVLSFKERPSIAKIEFKGNEDISDDQLDMVLKDMGLLEGRIFNPSQLEKITQELRLQYYSQGKYGVDISSDIVELENNLLEVTVTIDEGAAARIHQINLIGNHAYDDDNLLGRLELGEEAFISLFSSRDQYSKQKLTGDIETIRSYYMDRGYLEFNFESTQVSVTPDKQGIYITANLHEGEQYTVASIKLVGDLIIDEIELTALLQLATDDIFSRKLLVATTNALNERLGDEGYAFANVNAVPDVNKETRTVDLTIYIDPGKRVYVRNINIVGNTKTFDKVLRREVRQMEGGWLSTQKINRSRTRLQRLGYIQEVNVETPPVAGTSDQVDVNFHVKEGSSGSLQAGAGYGTNGAIFNLSVSEQNFLGSGENVRISFDNSQAVTTYNLSFTDPYYTLDGISRGVSFYSSSTNGGGASVADYNTDVLGTSLSYGFPLSEYNRARILFDYEKLSIDADASLVGDVIAGWVENNGDKFNSFKVTASVSHDSRDRTLFATDGFLQSLTLESTLPGSHLEFFKIRHKQTFLFPFIMNSSLSFTTDMGYGQSFGDTQGMPFFENFYLGGVNSLRGFASNSLGPTDTVKDSFNTTDEDGKTTTTYTYREKVIGGNKKLKAGFEWIFPSPFEEYKNSFRWSYFVDVGYVYGYDIAFDRDTILDELRASHGAAMKWVTPMGVLTFSLGYPIRSKSTDEEERFQFTIGAPF